MLASGATALGWHHNIVPRNVKGCWDLGFCGLGCPVNAKQSPLVTSIPDAIRSGAILAYNCPVDRLQHDFSRVSGVILKSGQRLLARHVALAAGAVNSPGILLRSSFSKALPQLGVRTCLHPSCFSLARFNSDIRPFYGAPQSVYSDEFLWPESEPLADGEMGFKLEAIPLQPVLASGLFARSSKHISSDMAKLKETSGMIALIRDGFYSDSAGCVTLDEYNTAKLVYVSSQKFIRTAKLALESMAACQFAAGARAVRPCHLQANRWFETLGDVQYFLKTASFETYQLGLGSAHLMGGASMGLNASNSVVNSYGKLHAIDGVSVVDGSVFPTSLGVNPQLTVMAFSLLASRQIQKLLKSVM